jgi:hypothetical protein
MTDSSSTEAQAKKLSKVLNCVKNILITLFSIFAQIVEVTNKEISEIKINSVPKNTKDL